MNCMIQNRVAIKVRNDDGWQREKEREREREMLMEGGWKVSDDDGGCLPPPLRKWTSARWTLACAKIGSHEDVVDTLRDHLHLSR